MLTHTLQEADSLAMATGTGGPFETGYPDAGEREGITDEAVPTAAGGTQVNLSSKIKQKKKDSRSIVSLSLLR